ncbi:MAG TPA: ribonuclease R [Pirellulaceae bacterium]|nr:ribonuclease R [Pirellulaceae bacterium]
MDEFNEESPDPATDHLDRLQQALLQLIDQPGYQPIKPATLAKRLKLDGDEVTLLKRIIKRLIRRGELEWGAKHLVRRPVQSPSPPPRRTDREKLAKVRSPAARHELVGIYRKANAGFGFVTPEDAEPQDRSRDVFIPPHQSADAVHGDVVRVQLGHKRHGADLRQSGRVVEVVRRRTHRFVGTYRESGQWGFVEIDGGQFHQPLTVGDAGAKNVRVGDKVLVEIVRFPSGFERGQAVIVEVFGPRGKPGVDTQMIIAEFNLPGPFAEAVLDDARKQAERFRDDQVPPGRNNYTTKTIITIDPANARDFDDAISLEQLDNGHWLLGVHIADVSHFVPRNSVLDHEAYDRATSVYLPDRVIPMLPEIISNNLASLQPHQPRLAMTVEIELTDDGGVIAEEWCRTLICSAHRFNYEEIDDYLANDKPWRKTLTADVFRLVRDMHTLAMKMRARRMKRGAIDLVLPEVAIDLDDDGRVAGAHVEVNTESHQVIEEFMLAANEAVARKLQDRGQVYLRRVHAPPNERRLRELTEFVRHLGIECESLESRFEIRRVLELSRRLPVQHAVHYAVLRSMQKAVYSPRELGHYALASDAYCHFTSPIRRYPDLVIHRMVGDLIDRKQPRADFEKLVQIGQHCSEREQRAEQAERELIKLKLLNYLAQRSGLELDGVITGVESYGLFVQGLDLPAEGLVPIESLPVDRYTYDPVGRCLTGFRAGNEYRLGDRLRVVVAQVDLDRRNLQYHVVQPGGKPPRAKSGRQSKSVVVRKSSGSRLKKRTLKGRADKSNRTQRRRKR